MTTMRSGTAAMGLVLLALCGAACDLNFDFEERNLQDQAPADMPAEEPRMCTPVVAEATPEYEAMCRHYCSELEATLTYLGKNQEPAGAIAQGCWELRCAPRCVTRETCGSQCHSIGYAYQELCRGVEVGPDSICPVSLDERVATCLAGCDVWTPPPGPPPPPKVER